MDFLLSDPEKKISELSKAKSKLDVDEIFTEKELANPKAAFKKLKKQMQLEKKNFMKQKEKKVAGARFIDPVTGKVCIADQPLEKSKWKKKYGRVYTQEDYEKLNLIQELAFSTIEPEEQEEIREYMEKRSKLKAEQSQK